MTNEVKITAWSVAPAGLMGFAEERDAIEHEVAAAKASRERQDRFVERQLAQLKEVDQVAPMPPLPTAAPPQEPIPSVVGAGSELRRFARLLGAWADQLDAICAKEQQSILDAAKKQQSILDAEIHRLFRQSLGYKDQFDGAREALQALSGQERQSLMDAITVAENLSRR